MKKPVQSTGFFFVPAPCFQSVLRRLPEVELHELMGMEEVLVCG